MELRMLKVNETMTFKSPIEKGLVRTGTVGEGSCGIHSILHAISKEYRDMKEPERKKHMRDLRKKISEEMTKEKWEQLGDGLVAKIPFQTGIRDLLEEFVKYVGENDIELSTDSEELDIVLKTIINRQFEQYHILFELLEVDEFEKNIFPKAFEKCEKGSLADCKQSVIDEATSQFNEILGSISEEDIDRNKREYLQKELVNLLKIMVNTVESTIYDSFVEKISDCSAWVDQYLIGFLSDYFNRDIYFVSGETRLPYIVGGCADYKRRESVIVLNLDNTHYEIMGRLLEGGKRVQREFKPDDPLIDKLYTYLCEPEKIKEKYPDMVEYLPKVYLRD